jgi:hypothetical protein
MPAPSEQSEQRAAEAREEAAQQAEGQQNETQDASEEKQENNEQQEPENRNRIARARAQSLQNSINIRANTKGISTGGHVTIGVGITDEGTNLVSLDQRWANSNALDLTDQVANIAQDVVDALNSAGIDAQYVGPTQLIPPRLGNTYYEAQHAEDYLLQSVKNLGCGLVGVGCSIMVCDVCAPNILRTFPSLESGLQDFP